MSDFLILCLLPRDQDLIIAGELSKFVPMSNQRTLEYYIHEEGSAGVKLTGYPGEVKAH